MRVGTVTGFHPTVVALFLFSPNSLPRVFVAFGLAFDHAGLAVDHTSGLAFDHAQGYAGYSPQAWPTHTAAYCARLTHNAAYS